MEASSRLLGGEHPNTLTTMVQLASTYRFQGRWREAEELQVNVMEVRSKLLGEEHSDTLTAMANLAHTLRSLGQNIQAMEMMGNSIRVSSKVLGYSHPDVVQRIQSVTSWAEECRTDSSTHNDDGDTILESESSD